MRLRAAALMLALMAQPLVARPIDRKVLVQRHAVHLDAIDRHAPVMLGNGELGFTADITGLQTFPEAYSPLAPLLTMAQWSWHNFPNPQGWGEADGLVPLPVPGRGTQPYPWIRAWSELESKPALNWLRENPHRFSLGRIALVLRHADGRAAQVSDLTRTSQRLDLWSGTLTSRFRFSGQPVTVVTRVMPRRDAVTVEVASPLVASGLIGVAVAYPGVSRKINPDPSDWDASAPHQTSVLRRAAGHLVLERRIDQTRYWSTLNAPGAAIEPQGAHRFVVRRPGASRLALAVSFDQADTAALPDPATAAAATAQHWQAYWRSGAAIDFSGSRDPRARELERRVVLSQYLAAINQAGSVPPQEEGLFSNSWNGKFHLEVMPLHLGHFAAWGRPALLERSLGWYLGNMPYAAATARRHGMPGLWWTKMAGPDGRNSPSTINPFIMWQQPAPIWLAELARRSGNGAAALARYGELVEQTAEMLAAWPQRGADGKLHLGPPIIPVQENHPPLTTRDPAFEVEFFRQGIAIAQGWRVQRGLPRRADWDTVIADLAPPSLEDGLIAPTGADGFWAKTRSPACSGNAREEDHCLNRDHPSFLLPFGLIRSDRIDPAVARRTMDAVKAHWDLRQTWGWDYPVLAMTSTRLGDPDEAIGWLFADQRNNRWGKTGMTPRVHLDAHAADLFAKNPGTAGEDGPGYRRAAETYFPSNGSLLLAVALMAQADHGRPLFPKGWKVRAEGFVPLP